MEKTIQITEVLDQENSLTLSELARAAGISPKTVFKRKERCPDASLEYLLRPVAGPRNTNENSAASAARKCGLKANTVQQRMRRNPGITLVEALAPVE